jgi:signal transduction histidine kinase
METILILAPYGKDAVLAASSLEKEGFFPKVIHSIAEISLDYIHTCGAFLLTEEALTLDQYRQLEKILSEQETWSDLPIILLISNKERIMKGHKILEHFSKGGNISLVERPFRLITLVTAINVALRARRRQYQVKELLKQQEISLRARDEFLSIASHELKTPITTLKLQVQMRRRSLKKGDHSVYQPPKVNSFIEMAEHQVERLERLVDDMLDISRIENGKLNLNYEEFDLGELVTKTAHSLTDEFQNANCGLEINIREAVKGLWDKYRVEQAVLNLFTNAIKYGSGCKITVDVFKENANAILKVKDEGMGIAYADQARIFQRFERAVEGGNISGLGLGLYITKEILEMQGGKISVESMLGKGSTFTVNLPL